MLGRRSVVVGASLGASTVLGFRGAKAQDAARTLKVIAPWEINGLDPVRSGFVFGRMQVAETLVGADDDGNVVPQLAKSWQLSEDRLTWRFMLQSNAKFHDGTAVTPAAVAAALERGRKAPAMLSNAPIESIAADGAGIVIRTKEPFLSLPAFLAHQSVLILAPSAYDDADGVKAVIGRTARRAASHRIGAARPSSTEMDLAIAAHLLSGCHATRPLSLR